MRTQRYVPMVLLTRSASSTNSAVNEVYALRLLCSTVVITLGALTLGFKYEYSRFPLRLNIACCVWWLRIAWLGSVAKTINFHSYGHHGIKFKGEARHTLSVAVREAVYHKFVLRNHHRLLMQI